MAIIDVLSSLPGVLFSYKVINELCHENNILTILDGAHSIGKYKLKKIHHAFVHAVINNFLCYFNYQLLITRPSPHQFE